MSGGATTSTVLFVDDESDVLAALEQLFVEDEGVSVVTATNADKALEVLSHTPVSLVVSDRMMPGTDGVELLSRIQKLYPDVRLAMLTGFADERPEEIIEALGDQLPVLRKPWNSDQLHSTLLGLLATEELDEEQAALMQHAGISLKQLKRAHKIRERMAKPPSLGEVLVELGMVTAEQLDELRRIRRSRYSIVRLLHEDGYLSDENHALYLEARELSPDLRDRDILLTNGLVTEEQYLRAVSAKYRIPYIEPEIGLIDTLLLEKVSVRYLLRHLALPLRVQDGKLQLILADPLDLPGIQEMERLFGRSITPCCCVAARIAETLRTLDRVRSGGDESSATLQYREIDELADMEEVGEEAVKVVDYLLLRAIQLGASDLHIEPQQNKIRVRVRVDGVLQPLTELPVNLCSRLVSRIKILAGADISEKRTHQDGKIFVKVEGSEVDIRVSSYVSVFGETLVLRLLDRNRNLVSMEQIGFTKHARSVIEEVILKASSGLVLITGPTGSGKTTTLYSFVDCELDPAQKIITCEDPVEYVMEGVVQCSANSKSGPTFADSLRAMVRQDPDTIIVGEIRDGETAGLAFESALTGHKVYSTFHTEDAVSVVIRLLDMGVEPFLVSSILSAVISQRLLRRLCNKCREPGEPSRADLRFLGIEPSQVSGIEIWKAGSCGECSEGYKGRLGIHEVLVPDDDFRDAILRRAPSRELRELARTLPEFLTLQEDALLKVAAGFTTLEEIVGSVPRDLKARALEVLNRVAGTGRKQ